tara:strand:- start:106 stop:258 length:153 start_codon:yes stop_codon:yes gene_type:complete
MPWFDNDYFDGSFVAHNKKIAVLQGRHGSPVFIESQTSLRGLPQQTRVEN